MQGEAINSKTDVTARKPEIIRNGYAYICKVAYMRMFNYIGAFRRKI